jgi:hypothetical protein
LSPRGVEESLALIRAFEAPRSVSELMALMGSVRRPGGG